MRKDRYELEGQVRAFWSAMSTLRVHLSALEIIDLMNKSDIINHEKIHTVEGPPHPQIKLHGSLDCGEATISFRYSDTEGTMTVWVYDK